MLLSALVASPAGAFELTGHETIEAAAYKRLLQLVVVPGTGTPGVSGRTLLATLIVTGDLEPPPCFDRMHPRGDCGPASRFALPLRAVTDYRDPLTCGFICIADGADA